MKPPFLALSSHCSVTEDLVHRSTERVNVVLHPNCLFGLNYTRYTPLLLSRYIIRIDSKELGWYHCVPADNERGRLMSRCPSFCKRLRSGWAPGPRIASRRNVTERSSRPGITWSFISPNGQAAGGLDSGLSSHHIKIELGVASQFV